MTSCLSAPQAVVALLKAAGGGGELVVAFRGTEAGSEDPNASKNDWATDAAIKMVPPTQINGVSLPKFDPKAAKWKVNHPPFLFAVWTGWLVRMAQVCQLLEYFNSLPRTPAATVCQEPQLQIL
jgi:hypothetical protein